MRRLIGCARKPEENHFRGIHRLRLRLSDRSVELVPYMYSNSANQRRWRCVARAYGAALPTDTSKANAPLFELYMPTFDPEALGNV